jgi:hypothetical protein
MRAAEMWFTFVKVMFKEPLEQHNVACIRYRQVENNQFSLYANLLKSLRDVFLHSSRLGS